MTYLRRRVARLEHRQVEREARQVAAETGRSTEAVLADAEELLQAAQRVAGRMRAEGHSLAWGVRALADAAGLPLDQAGPELRLVLQELLKLWRGW